MKKIIYSLLMAVMIGISTVQANESQLMVIVHPDNELKVMSKQELREIFTGDKMYFENRKISSYLSSNPKESTIVLEKVYQLRNQRLLKKMWLKKLYRGIVFTQPSIVESARDVIANVAKNPSGIGIIAAQSVPKNVKILKVDNQLYL